MKRPTHAEVIRALLAWDSSIRNWERMVTKDGSLKDAERDRLGDLMIRANVNLRFVARRLRKVSK